MFASCELFLDVAASHQKIVLIGDAVIVRHCYYCEKLPPTKLHPTNCISQYPKWLLLQCTSKQTNKLAHTLTTVHCIVYLIFVGKKFWCHLPFSVERWNGKWKASTARFYANEKILWKLKQRQCKVLTAYQNTHTFTWKGRNSNRQLQQNNQSKK